MSAGNLIIFDFMYRHLAQKRKMARELQENIYNDALTVLPDPDGEGERGRGGRGGS
jgi:hypothetical protein